jgi:hypothetical protein
VRVKTYRNLLFKRGTTVAAVVVGALVGLAATNGVRAHRTVVVAPAVEAAVLVQPHSAEPHASLVAAPAAKQAPARRARRAAPRATISLYEHTTDPSVLRRQGCSAAKRGVGGIVILDFGQPAYNGHTYGTNLFSGRFAGNAQITRGLLGYAHGYVYCLRRGSELSITLARGTSNYHPAVPSTYKAGRKWARETRTLAHHLRRHGLDGHVVSAAADDVEPAWDRSFHRTRDFFRGYRDAHTGHLLYNYGSLDGGVGSIWNARQAFFVAAGMRYARVIPEIYNHAMARQWAELAHIAKHRYHRPLQFAGVMTTHSSGSGGMKPRDAHSSLVRALAGRVGSGAPAVPPTLTNIRSAH